VDYDYESATASTALYCVTFYLNRNAGKNKLLVKVT
jgi:hypothetical protein